MTDRNDISLETVLYVRDNCLCLHVQRAARALARMFDNAFKPVDLNNGQFSLMMALNRPQAPALGEVAAFLAMDRTTLTAKLKPLERRGLVEVLIDKDDRRGRRLVLTHGGKALLKKALPIWRDTHAELDEMLNGESSLIRDGLSRLL